jgi:hypothetical protein
MIVSREIAEADVDADEVRVRTVGHSEQVVFSF